MSLRFSSSSWTLSSRRSCRTSCWDSGSMPSRSSWCSLILRRARPAKRVTGGETSLKRPQGACFTLARTPSALMTNSNTLTEQNNDVQYSQFYVRIHMIHIVQKKKHRKISHLLSQFLHIMIWELSISWARSEIQEVRKPKGLSTTSHIMAQWMMTGASTWDGMGNYCPLQVNLLPSILLPHPVMNLIDCPVRHSFGGAHEDLLRGDLSANKGYIQWGCSVNIPNSKSRGLGPILRQPFWVHVQ